MPPSISPWAPHAVLPSPDGKLVAEIEAMEIGMGGPTFGELSISNRMTRDACNPSMVWSDCSGFLAVPQWTHERRQRLMIVSIKHRGSRYLGPTFRVLELHSFNGGIVVGVDSPIHMTRRFKLSIGDLDWGG